MGAVSNVSEGFHIALEVEEELKRGNGELVVWLYPVTVGQFVDADGLFHRAWLWCCGRHDVCLTREVVYRVDSRCKGISITCHYICENIFIEL